MHKVPPHILVTTPESLYILLTTSAAAPCSAHARTLIVDEIHALAGEQARQPLRAQLERLEHLVRSTAAGCSASACRRRSGRSNTPPACWSARPAVRDRRHRPPARARPRVEVPGAPLDTCLRGEHWTEIFAACTR
jgi:ATP-dependent Lhr-like helicase